MNRKQTAADIVMNELLWCGGEQMTRKQIQDELLEAGYERWLVDFYLFCLSNHQPKTEKEPSV
jgi:hypothetical protein